MKLARHQEMFLFLINYKRILKIQEPPWSLKTILERLSQHLAVRKTSLKMDLLVQNMKEIHTALMQTRVLVRMTITQM